MQLYVIQVLWAVWTDTAVHITEPNTIKLFIPYNYFNTGCKYYKKEKPTCKKGVIDQASGQDGCTLKMQ